LPEYRDAGLGFKLKRAQWQLVRQQGLDLITWTYDPLETRNANLNIAKLGAVCNTYLPEFYGKLTDEMNAGLPSDRFRVDLWVNSDRANTRLSSKPRRRLDLADFLAAEVPVLNTTQLNRQGFAIPHQDDLQLVENADERPNLVLVEVPANFQEIKAADIGLAVEWRLYSRKVFQLLFEKGYIVTDFVFLAGKHARAYYVLSYGESLLGVK
jgi:predicted GNAT superfamily acetyltransferase